LPRRPIALFVVALSIVAMFVLLLLWPGRENGGRDSSGVLILAGRVVHWSEVDNLLAVALGVFLLSYVESISVPGHFPSSMAIPISAGAELLALGFANLAAGVGQGYPSRGRYVAIGRNEKGGAQTPVALVVASTAFGVVLLFLDWVDEKPA